jgi:hypothetical protein
MSAKVLKHDLHLLLARLKENCPDRASVVGVFSALSDDSLHYELLGSGDKKLEERLKVPHHAYYAAMLPVLSGDFEKHHKIKPAFLIEWFILGDAWQLGVASLTEVMVDHIREESVLHDTAPDDWRDLILSTHCLGFPEASANDSYRRN